ncbi:MMPL family transporter [Streptomyces sp. NBC_00191]|uniref:MMPL family transporter n=1 Tax=Streptomyces sp. NBC_00191 TaxID=2975674 RepID=UPI003253E80C
MLARIGRAVTARPKTFLLAIIGFVVLSGALGAGVVSKLAAGGFEDPAAQSSLAREALAEDFGVRSPNLVLLVKTEGSVDEAAAGREGAELARRLGREPGIEQVTSYWTSGKQPSLRDEQGNTALVLAHIGGDETAAAKRIDGLRKEFSGSQGVLEVELGGSVAAAQDTEKAAQEDLMAMERIAFPVLFLVLMLVFGSLVAALLPILMTIPVVLGVLLLLRIMAEFMDVSVVALNATTIIGLGLAIDYSLFVVSRYREELQRHGGDVTDRDVRSAAIVASVRTAGRTVLFSALTVMLSLAALAVFPLYFLRSIAVAGIGVSLFAALAAVVVVPTLLALFGSKINSLDVRKPFRRRAARAAANGTPPRERRGFWHRTATLVMRFPLPIAAVGVIVLLALGSPFTGVRFSLPDDRQLPKSSESRQVGEALRTDFDSREADAVTVVAVGIGDVRAKSQEIGGYAQRLSQVDGVASVTSFAGVFTDGARVAGPGPATAPTASAAGTYLRVVPAVETYSDSGERLVDDLRAVQAPWPVKMTGAGPALADTKETLGDHLPLVLGFIAVAMFVLLFLFSGSVVLPLKALVLNVLSLSATFGAMVWIFQDGHLSGWLDFTATGALTAVAPILMFCLLFGLSMDYEVFMLSRIKEAHDAGADDIEAVAGGLQRTGGLVTSAAALMGVVTIAGLFTSTIAFQKMFALGLTLALFIDALVVRGLLLPAFMRLMGPVNWWAPAPLRRLHRRFGIAEEPAETRQGPGTGTGSETATDSADPRVPASPSPR